jgi:hypothetical protein
LRTLIIILILCGLSFTATATDLPTRIEISYEVEAVIGQGELNETMIIKQEDDAIYYSISSKAQATGVLKLVRPGSIKRNSQGTITALGLRPDQFSDKRSKKKPRIATFNWDDNSLTIQYKGKEALETLPVGTLDILSLSYNFMFASLTEKSVEIPLTDARGLKLIQYSIHEETIDTPLGELETIVLTRQPKKDDKIKRRIWFSPSHHMLPVRIVSTGEDGLTLEKTVTEINLSYKNK